jgi:selenocysteine-specific elongation factor
VHHGARDVTARAITLADDGLVQLRLEAPLAAFSGDRVVLRSISQPETLGGGEVIDPTPARHSAKLDPASLDRLRKNRPADEASRTKVVDPKRAGVPPEIGQLEYRIKKLLDEDGLEPRSPRMIAEKLRARDDQIEAGLSKLLVARQATLVAPRIYYSAIELEKARSRVLALFNDRDELSVAELRDLLGTSRKYAQCLLEYLDAQQVTIRIGDKHVLRQHRSQGSSFAAD